MQRLTLVLLVALAVPLLPACESAPRQRPVKGADVDAGAASMEAARRQLTGTWDLVSLDLFRPSGEKVPAQATGRLKYDEFGNLAMQGSLNGGAEVDPSLLNLTGRVVIDPVLKAFRFQAINARTIDEKRIDPKLDPAHIRYYEFVGVDMLKTTTKTAQGVTTAIATWKRVP
jgi:hypothetical protein